MNITIIILISVILLSLSAAFSGLNIGLLMARPEELKRKAAKGDKVASRVYEYRKNGNYLIVCVLIGNVAVISAMSLVLNSVTGGIVAGLLTTALVTAFGEILPQSLFSRKGWRLSRYFFWLLDIIFIILWPIAKPISLLLDKFLGEELPMLYSREEITHMIEDHAKHEKSSIDLGESRIISGALTFSEHKVKEKMVAKNKAVTIAFDEELDYQEVLRLQRTGHSRIPVYDKNLDDFVGILFMKDLILKSLPTKVSKVYRDKLYDIHQETNLDTALSRFIQTKTHMSAVTDDNDQVVGFITLEDVIEEILNRKITDEHDQSYIG